MLTALIQNDLILLVFIVAVPLVLAGAAVVGLFAVGALFHALDAPELVRARIQATFRRPPAEPHKPEPGHYYRPFWAR